MNKQTFKLHQGYSSNTAEMGLAGKLLVVTDT